MRRTSAQKCRDLAEQHGWTELCDEGDCISINCPPGKIHAINETHGLIVSYGDGCSDYGGFRSRASAYAIISREIESDILDNCDDPDSACPDKHIPGHVRRA